MEKLPQIVARGVGTLFAIGGLYAFLAPRAFFDTLATFEPYNRHFVHDIGAFQIAIGIMLLLAASTADGLLAALWGASIGQLFHLISHVIDNDLGEKQSTTIPFLVIVTVLLYTVAVVRMRNKART